jgi:type II secretory pathway pseudopilin PulG
MFNKKFKNKIKLDYIWLKKFAGKQAGMTYVELVVVLSIFATMSSIVMFNYGDFQAKIDIKNLASDIALKIVQAQRYSVAGKLPSESQQIAIGLLGGGLNSWKPSYGLNFKKLSPKSFVYFTDIDSDRIYDSADGELVESIDINKGNSVSNLEIFDSGNVLCSTPSELNIVFVRPSSVAIINSGFSAAECLTSYAVITVSSATASANSKIRVYTSGRIEIK